MSPTLHRQRGSWNIGYGPPPPAPPAELFVPNFYISPTGDSGGSGSQSQPWGIDALETRTAAIFAGAKIGILGGPTDVYRVTRQGTGQSGALGARISLNFNGDPGNPTIVQCINPVGSGPIFTDNPNYPAAGPAQYSPNGMNIGMFGVNSNQIRVRRMQFADLSWGGIITNGSDQLYEGIDIFDVRFSRSGGFLSGDNCPGVRIGIADGARGRNVTFRHSRVRHVRNGPNDLMSSSGDNAAGWQVYNTENVLWENVTVEDAWSGLFFKNYGQGCTSRRCFLRLVNQPFLGQSFDSTSWFDGGAHTQNVSHIIEDSIALDAWDFFEGNVANRAANMIVRRNTIVFDDFAGSVSGQAKYSNPQGVGDLFSVDFHDVIMYYRGARSDHHRLSSSTPAAAVMFGTLNNNCYPQSGFGCEGAAGQALTSLAAWRTHVGGARELASIQTDNPQFVNVNGITPEDFKLNGGPCVGTGTGGQNMGAYPSSGQTEKIGHDFSQVGPI